MSKVTTSAIRLTITNEISSALLIAKRSYPTLSDPEILKLGLSKIVRESNGEDLVSNERNEIRRLSAYSVGQDYLSDTDEDLYTSDMGKRVQFS